MDNYLDKSERESREKTGKKVSVICIICNLILCAAKGAAGIVFGTLSVLADAINNLSDASSNIIAFLGFRLAGKPADSDHPYGHGRYEYLAGMVVAILILVVGVELLKTGIEKIITPGEMNFSVITVIVLSVSIAVKTGMMILNYKVGKKISSETLIATGADSRNDVIATAAVLTAVIISHFAEVNLDGYMTVAVSLFILVSGLKIIKDTLDPILGRAPDPELVEHIRKKIAEYPETLGIHDLIVHDYGPGRLFASVHVEMSDKLDPTVSHEIIDTIERDFFENEQLQVVIHYDPIAVSDPLTNEMRKAVQEIVQSIDPKMTIHDLRIVKGKENNNVIFDCVVPRSVTASEKDLRNEISCLVKEKYPNFSCVITFDVSYISE